MAQVKAQGRVVEARPNLLAIIEGVGPLEVTYPVKAHHAVPGSHVVIYDDGRVEVLGHAGLPPNVKEIALPMHPAATDDPDYS